MALSIYDVSDDVNRFAAARPRKMLQACKQANNYFIFEISLYIITAMAMPPAAGVCGLDVYSFESTESQSCETSCVIFAYASIMN
jgi:hypothetical protein